MSKIASVLRVFEQDVRAFDDELDIAILHINCTKSISRTAWYHQCYRGICSYFAANIGTIDFDVAAVKTCLVSSWVAKILKPDFKQEAVDRFARLSKQLTNQSISSANISLSRDGDRNVELIIVGNDGFPVSVRKLYSACNDLLNQGSDAANVATVSKYLHFEHPKLFPILDNTICKRVFNQENLRNRYLEYIDDTRLLCTSNENNYWSRIAAACAKCSVSEIRILDTILMNIVETYEVE